MKQDTPQTELLDRIYNLLVNTTEATAIRSRVIEHTLGIPGTKVRESISALRNRYIPVASGTPGYWLARNYEELESTIRHLESRASKEITDARRLRKIYSRNPVVRQTKEAVQLSIFQ